MNTRPLLESFQASKWAQPNARVSHYYIVEVKMSNKCEITQFTHTRVMHSVESVSFCWKKLPKMYSDWSLCSLLRFNEQANSQAREAPKNTMGRLSWKRILWADSHGCVKFYTCLAMITGRNDQLQRSTLRSKYSWKELVWKALVVVHSNRLFFRLGHSRPTIRPTEGLEDLELEL